MKRSVLLVMLLPLALLFAGLPACGTTGVERAAGLSLSDTPLNGKFVWHDLMSDDVERTRRFYGGLLGWSFEDTTHPNGGDYTLISKDGRYIGGIVPLDDPAGVEYSRWLGYLSVPDVDASAAMTRQAGGEVVAGPLDVSGIGRAAAIRDPQGAVVGLLRSERGDPDDSVEPAAGHVVWNELLASDAGYAAAFYGMITGAQVKTVSRRGGKYTLLRAQDRDRAGIMTRPADDIDPLWLTHFAVADPAAAAARAAELGGEVLLPPSPEFRDGSTAVVVDPTGAILALRRWPE